MKEGGDAGRRVSNRGSECERCPRGEILLSFKGLVMRKRWRGWGLGEEVAALALEVSLLHYVTIAPPHIPTITLYPPEL